MLKSTRLRAAAVILLMVIIIGLFVYYINGHPAIISTLKHIDPYTLIALLGCYCVMLLIWMGVYNATLRLCGEPLKSKENLLLTIYSTLANFFLPLQSGPGVRAGYLKRRHKIPVSAYLMSALIYYGMYAVISAGFLFVAASFWWLAIPAVIAATLISLAVIYFARNRFLKKSPNLKLYLNRRYLMNLFFLTLCQLALQALIYGIELHGLDLHETIRRVVSYTGAANFSLFVSLTPGAIGFREAFLEFSQRLHHFSTTAILSANLIDRGVFLVFLACLFILMLATHARNRLKV